jgi:hypothetical protein
MWLTITILAVAGLWITMISFQLYAIARILTVIAEREGEIVSELKAFQAARRIRELTGKGGGL